MIENSMCHGHFTMTDEQGNIIVDQDNMIVKSGREKIMESGFPTKNLYLFISANPDMTTAGDKYANSYKDNDIEINNIEIPLEEKDEDKKDNVFASDKKNINITINASHSRKDNASEFTACSAGLAFEDGNDKTLFSRLSFEPKHLNAGATYNIKYIIQF